MRPVAHERMKNYTIPPPSRHTILAGHQTYFRVSASLLQNATQQTPISSSRLSRSTSLLHHRALQLVQSRLRATWLLERHFEDGSANRLSTPVPLPTHSRSGKELIAVRLSAAFAQSHGMACRACRTQLQCLCYAVTATDLIIREQLSVQEFRWEICSGSSLTRGW